MHATAIVVAGGRGTRFGGARPKQLLPLLGRPLLVWPLAALEQARSITDVVLVTTAEEVAQAPALLAAHGLRKVVRICAGGAERLDSVRAGLAALPTATELVAVHDAARPLLTPELVDRTVAAAAEAGAALPAVAVRDTLKQAADEVCGATLDRRGLYLAQTPQVFRRELLCRAYAAAATTADATPITDDAQLVERLGHPVRLVAGDPANFKVTLPADLALAEAWLRARARTADGAPDQRWPRVGVGYDVHRLVAGRPLILGGVTIPFPLGLLGHSDADVLAHAVGDALLGAAALGDLGTHFPPDDPAWRGASSLGLLQRIAALVAAIGWRLGNVDAVVVCERPRLAPHVPAMRERLAAALDASLAQLSVKATTTERLGFAGREEGIAAHATVLLVPE